MDHLLIPEACQPQALSVPYLGFAPKYDKLGFKDFPERCHHNPDDLISSHNLNPWRKERVESFFQEWLWFGVMDEFAKACCINLDLDAFVTNNPSGSGRVITTASLGSLAAENPPRTNFNLMSALAEDPNLVQRMLQGLAPALETATMKRLWAATRPTGERIKLAEIIGSAQQVLRVVTDRRVPLLRIEIVLSVDILCESIAQLVDARFGEKIELRPSNIFQRLETIMIARNWCPSRITPIVTQASTSLNYIACLLPSFEPESHRGCRPRKCFKRISTAEGVSPLHRDSCTGDCPEISIEERDTIQMWKSGGIPGFRPMSGVKSDQLEIVDCNGQRFVAISHVWAHGMGNTSKNALPKCQVEFLWNSVKQVAGEDAVLWVDPLSVPIDPEIKSIAIAKLRKVYEEACKVLVIDKDLVQVGNDEIEQILQPFCSEWQRRLWTLQEGRLARDLYVQFKHRAVPVSVLMASNLRSQSGESGTVYFPNTRSLKIDVEHRFRKIKRDYKFFLNLAEDLASRSATKESDEPICLAIMLGLDLNEFHHAPRMEDIYRSFSSLPQDLIFLNQPRLQSYGLTWAPSTFLEIEFVHFLDGAVLPGPLSNDGIHIVKDCLLLQQDFNFRRVVGNGVYIIEASNGENYAVEPQDFVSSDGHSSIMQLNRTISKPAAVVWEKSTELFETVSKAVLVSALQEKNRITSYKFEMRLNGWRVGEGYKDLHESNLKRSGGIIAHIPADFVKRKKLCVG